MSTRVSSAEAMQQAGAQLARNLHGGDVVLLSGELGAGKTTFVRGAARELGVTVPVRSPTFTIGSRYRGSTWAVAHLDLYRIGDLGAEDPDLLADYLGPDSVAFIEWPGGAEQALAELGRIRYRVAIEHAGGDERELEIEDLAAAEAAGADAVDAGAADAEAADAEAADAGAVDAERAP